MSSGAGAVLGVGSLLAPILSSLLGPKQPKAPKLDKVDTISPEETLAAEQERNRSLRRRRGTSDVSSPAALGSQNLLKKTLLGE